MLLLSTSGFNHCAISSAAKFISNVKWHLLKNIYGQENDCMKAALFFHRFSLQVCKWKPLILLMKWCSQQWDWLRLLWSKQLPAPLWQTAFRQTTPSQKAEQTYCLVYPDYLVNNINTTANLLWDSYCVILTDFDLISLNSFTTKASNLWCLLQNLQQIIPRGLKAHNRFP